MVVFSLYVFRTVAFSYSSAHSSVLFRTLLSFKFHVPPREVSEKHKAKQPFSSILYRTLLMF
jgi:hypothetical protein